MPTAGAGDATAGADVRDATTTASPRALATARTDVITT
jgi:hypothetical protein